ncbi:hypothetical protein [Marinovum sp.]|uniref:hypothetical protein n=1 Tax=Marinovum sp. TaxID=2024839 RepID=UPI003A928F20
MREAVRKLGEERLWRVSEPHLNAGHSASVRGKLEKLDVSSSSLPLAGGKWKKFFIRSAREGLRNILSDDTLFRDIENALEREIEYIRKILRLSKRKLVVLGEHRAAHNVILIEACKREGIPTIVFFHGYLRLNKGAAAAVLPVNADYLVVFTETERQKIVEMSPRDCQKVLSFGFTGVEGDPRDAWRQSDAEKVITYFAGPIKLEENLLRIGGWEVLDFFEVLSKACRDAGYRFSIRLHPKSKEIDDPRIMKEIRSRYEVSSNSLVVDALASRCVIGCASTSLLRAASIGCPVFNLTDQGDVMAALPDMTADAFCRMLSENEKSLGATRVDFQSDSFLELLKRLV